MSLNSGSLNWSFDCIDIKEGWNYDAGNYAAILELCCYFGIMLLLFFKKSFAAELDLCCGT